MSMPMQPDSFRRACGLYPTGVAVVTACHGDTRMGMTINSFTSVSLEPPLVSWSLRSSSRSRSLLEAAKGFAINILSEDQHDLALRFARSSGDPFDELDLDHAPDTPPGIPGALVQMRCTTSAIHEAGDHLIFIGEVTHVTQGEGNPLVFFAGRMSRPAL